MVNKSLVNFIKENLSQGYDAVAVRNHLIKSGFVGRDIDEAFNAVYQKKPEGKKVNVGVIIIVMITLLIAIGISFWLLFAFDEKEEFQPFPEQAQPNAPQGCFNGIKDGNELFVNTYTTNE